MKVQGSEKMNRFVSGVFLGVTILLFGVLSSDSFAQTKIVDSSMVFVEGGTFQMGSNFKSEQWSTEDERPIHAVTVGNFYMRRFEISQPEWIAVMGESRAYYPGDSSPIETVTWYDAVEFCNKRSEQDSLTPVYTIDKTKKDPNNVNPEDEIRWLVTVNWNANGYRLPTEAEWEYAARGGKNSKGYTYSGSNNLDNVAWYGFYTGTGTSLESTNPVGRKAPNELGLYDMSGNVWEWCWDWYGEEYYSQNAGKNPTGPTTGSSRSMRGGSWDDIPEFCAVSDRSKYYPFDWNYNLGIRLVQSFIKKEK